MGQEQTYQELIELANYYESEASSCEEAGKHARAKHDDYLRRALAQRAKELS